VLLSLSLTWQAHFTLDLLTEQEVAQLMDYIESHPDALS
jgi:hypothetical protein